MMAVVVANRVMSQTVNVSTNVSTVDTTYRRKRTRCCHDSDRADVFWQHDCKHKHYVGL